MEKNEMWNGYDAWTNVALNTVSRMEALSPKIEAFEKSGCDLARNAIDEGANALKGMLAGAAPFVWPGAPYDAWKTMIKANVSKMTALQDQISKWESAGADEARKAVDEGARVLKETVAFVTKSSADLRAQSVKASRNAMSFMGAK